mmetsp:Transcript_12434/g.36633  ORF Transcript_12434/g.36633 Transcript_12434/m.36633 type:complete len:371 (-) Transcript_12434:270-1382(-)
MGRRGCNRSIRRSRSLAMSFLIVVVVFAVALGGAAASSAVPSRRALPLVPSILPRFVPRGGGASRKHLSLLHEEEEVGPMEVFLRTVRDARRHLCAAAAARCVSIFGMYPMDTVKTRMQMEQANPLRLKGMYKGVGGSLLGQVPYGVLTFGSYEIYKDALLKRLPTTPPAFIYALSAVLGDVTGSGWLCPSEVVKQQLQAGMYPSTSAAVKGIWNKRGFGGFYQGYFGGLARDVPFRVAQLTSYEVTKKIYLRAKARRVVAAPASDDGGVTKAGKVELSPIDAALVGAIAGSFSAAITAPLDRIKTLLMTDSSGYGSTVVSCASKIWEDEGLKGFFAGVVPRVTYIAPSVAIFFIAYEAVQQRMAPSTSE